MSEPPALGDLGKDWLRPTPGRVMAAVVIGLAAFFAPQKIALEWYPLNHPGTDILYIEITCSSNEAGEIHLFYDTAGSFEDNNSIEFAISPSVRNYTYAFPLPDAPITGLRLDPVGNGATIMISQMRIIDRRGIEVAQFAQDKFLKGRQIASILPYPDGWMITSALGSNAPDIPIALRNPVVAVGMNGRNLHRCLLSTAYLTLMLLILLATLQVLFGRIPDGRNAAIRLGFLALIALIFALVGNRGLIRNSIRYARFGVATQHG
jgi:hypothetical protein